ncbi:MAG: protein phosphatase 2C domain-containing protein [Candidatus Vogelbacteria bacterium]|nr:protein phosphatase 2C domain-containing protein [Candidatus Vogelbacteria bacterium]
MKNGQSMKYLSILERPTKEAIQQFAKKRNLTDYMAEDYEHPQEDYLIASDTPPVFVVSDGVTLNFRELVESNTKYPNPSPAGEVSRIFCEAVIKSAKEKYDRFDMESIVSVFKEANREVGEYNGRIGKSDISGNKTGFYSATGSFVVICENKAYWASICDSFIAHFDKKMDIKFISTGICTPYAVINGEEQMADYLESGALALQKGDRIFVFTDGFEQYVKNSDFQKLFLEWNENIQGQIATFSEKMNLENPEKYGHERSLIVICF